MKATIWQKMCLLCGSKAQTEFAFLPNLAGCPQCSVAIGSLRPLGVDQEKYSIELFQTYSVAPSNLHEIYDRIEALGITGRKSDNYDEISANEYQKIVESIFQARITIDIGLPNLIGYNKIFPLIEGAQWHLADCSGLKISGTAKDLRTQGIIHSVMHSNVRNLACWTAGNAGLSLVRAASHLRASSDGKDDIKIHLLASSEVESSILQTLRQHGAGVTVSRVREPLSTRQTIEACGGNPYDGTWLDVTDGWDEAGVLMYRLYAYFLMTICKPDFVVAPIGTGGLFIGFLLGISDYLESRPCATVNLVGAIPVGSQSTVPPLIEGKEPVAPKLFGPYSPFGLVLSALYNGCRIFGKSDRLNVSWSRVNLSMQMDALRQLDRSVTVCEPSAAVAIASAFDCDRRARGIVISTGFGILGLSEMSFLKSLIV